MTTTDDAGRFLELDRGRSAVRFERVYARPVAAVWAAVTDPTELAQWFPAPKVTLDLVPDAEITFGGDPSAPDLVTTGRILVAERPRRLHFTWGADELHFDLAPLPGGGTRFALTDVLDVRAAAARNAAGWELCLAALTAHLGGGEHAGPHAGPSAAWEDRYAAYLTAGFPSGAPIPGRD
ncbi:SRPBCC domain-containing protein [Streptacidiphilus sp. MAP5-3]|jgi:uncharacterized protein YndB with AHSA1/START domain|uniref:SRPBCC domain-containing protein n=1 Tax=unclassified Streptacidiphilus TaxID=2643834 RepID=UPI0035173A4C